MDSQITQSLTRKASLSPSVADGDEEETTEIKLAMLASLLPELDQAALLDLLLAHDGSVGDAVASAKRSSSKRAGVAGASQTSLRSFITLLPSSLSPVPPSSSSAPKRAKLAAKKGTTLHLFSPDDISTHTPCTIILNFLPAADATALLRELLAEAATFERSTFKLFDSVVTSSHSTCFFVGTAAEQEAQRAQYVYNGARLTDVRRLTPGLEGVRPCVAAAVNAEIRARIRDRYPGGRKLRYQNPGPWTPNAAFVNCYDGPCESVGWHSDQLTYLGPRAVIGSLSLGVAREFRVRRVVPRDDDDDDGTDRETRPPGVGVHRTDDDNNDPGDEQGQIAIHLPHNSLLVMHADMQEEWKHSIAPAATVVPHPVSGTKRINVTYRDYRPAMHPRFTPRCRCGVATVLRVVQKKRASRGRYFWMCHAGNVPGREGCSFFQWAEFDDDGNPR